MSFQQVAIELPAACAEAVSDALLARGALSVEVSDAHDGAIGEEPIFGEPGEFAGLWSQCKLSALFGEAADVGCAVAQALAAEGVAHTLPLRVEQVADRDWVRLTQQQFGPLEITPRLWIVPTWHTPPNPEAINLVLDPGLAFGTGSHPSTRLCLRWLEQQISGGETVLDYGCGSGVLAIAAAKLGAAQVFGVDIDPAAVAVAHENAARNGVAARFTLPDALPKITADLVVANILANPLKLLASILVEATRTGGQLALAGILRDQALDVAASYAPHFALSIYAQEANWVCLAGTKNR